MIKVTVLGSGSAGNSIVISNETSCILVDAGFSGAELTRRLHDVGIDLSEILAILISHEHDDHVQGVRVFSKRNGNIPIYSNSLTYERLKMKNKSSEKFRIFSNGVSFRIGPFDIEAFSVSHDAVDPVGFSIRCKEKNIGIATDLGHFGKMVPLKLHDSHLLILESNHDPELLRSSKRPPHLQHRIRGRRGHLSNENAAELISSVTGPLTENIILAHLSSDCNNPDIAREKASQSLIKINRSDVNIIIAEQDRVSKTILL